MLLKQASKLDRKSCNWTKCDSVLIVVALVSMTIAVICAFTILPRWNPDPNRHRHRDGEGNEDHKPQYFRSNCHVENIELTGREIECTQNEFGEWCDQDRDDEEPDQSGSHTGADQHSQGQQGQHQVQPSQGQPPQGHSSHGDDDQGSHTGQHDQHQDQPPQGHSPHDDDDNDEDDHDESHHRRKRSHTHQSSQSDSWSLHHSGRNFPCMRVRVRYQADERHGGGEHHGLLHSDWRESENFPRVCFNEFNILLTFSHTF